MFFLCKWKAVWTAAVDPLCRVSCSSTAAGCTLNPDYTSETHENNVSKAQKEKSPLSGCFSLRKKKKKRKTQSAVRGSCRRKTLREVGGNPWGTAARNMAGGGATTRPHHKNHHRAAVHRVTSQVDSVLDMWRFFLFLSLDWGEEMQHCFTTPTLQPPKNEWGHCLGGGSEGGRQGGWVELEGGVQISVQRLETSNLSEAARGTRAGTEPLTLHSLN